MVWKNSRCDDSAAACVRSAGGCGCRAPSCNYSIAACGALPRACDVLPQPALAEFPPASYVTGDHASVAAPATALSLLCAPRPGPARTGLRMQWTRPAPALADIHTALPELAIMVLGSPRMLPGRRTLNSSPST